MRIVFMGTPAFAVPTLVALVEAGHEVAAAYTQPPRPAGRGKQLQPSAVQREAEARGINPFDHGPLHTDMWKTEGLKQALDKYGFDVAFGGARRDEEKSRAKERVFSFRSANHRWDPKNQRPELWNLYNARKAKGESIRVFPISNWTELDVWQYIHLEDIPIVPLYFSAKRPTVERDGLTYAAGDLAKSLDSGTDATGTRTLAKFADGTGVPCRAFMGSDVSGIACRERGGWHLRVIRDGVSLDDPAAVARTEAALRESAAAIAAQ